MLIALHATACMWVYIINFKDTWRPTLLGTSKYNYMYDPDYIPESYFTAFYYGCLALFGNEIYPTRQYETLVVALFNLSGSIIVGLLIGEFSALILKMNLIERKEIAKKNFMHEIIKQLKLSFEFRNRIYDYYDRVSSFNIDRQFVFCHSRKVLQTTFRERHRKDQIVSKINNNSFQSERFVLEGGLFEQDKNEIFFFLRKVKIAIFLEGDVILKQGDIATKFFFVNDGFVEVI
jgi:hypothetical protein